MVCILLVCCSFIKGASLLFDGPRYFTTTTNLDLLPTALLTHGNSIHERYALSTDAHDAVSANLDW